MSASRAVVTSGSHPSASAWPRETTTRHGVPRGTTAAPCVLIVGLGVQAAHEGDGASVTQD